jgi:hypothetical protein
MLMVFCGEVVLFCGEVVVPCVVFLGVEKMSLS